MWDTDIETIPSLFKIRDEEKVFKEFQSFRSGFEIEIYIELYNIFGEPLKVINQDIDESVLNEFQQFFDISL